MRSCAFLLSFCLLLVTLSPVPVSASAGSGPKLETPSAILMEASTGTVLFEKNAHKKMKPASITKIMTLLLIFEALEKGQIKEKDMVPVSEHAASMGGSQVFLEPGEQQSVHDLLKCISIASANDACAAMAEFIAGSESAFVEKMNQKAKELGMKDTHFVNCCGLDARGHLTSAGDIAVMARELSRKHPKIFDYCRIWMDTITHRTRKGETKFGLTNTNKLIRYYSHATGLKTGYTSQSKYCLAATASRDDVDLIAVVMAEKTPSERTKEAITLLDYGFSVCRIFRDTGKKPLADLPVEGGTYDSLPLDPPEDFSYVILDGSGRDTIKKSVLLPEKIEAPVKKGTPVGSVVYTKDDKEIGRVPIVAGIDIPAPDFFESFLQNLGHFLCMDAAQL